MFEARVYRILIASPSDVQQERELADETITKWNRVNAVGQLSILLPLRWEVDAFPQMGDRPQEFVNRQLVDNADLLVAIFWHRVGSPTGAEISGTVEEIKRHVKAGKHAMVYFCEAPRPPEAPSNPTQERALLEFRAWCQEHGLISTYEQPHDFQALLEEHLQRAVYQRFGLTTAPASTVRPTLSNDALELLLAAIADNDGEITVIRYDGGYSIFANGRDFTGDKPPREVAVWEAALTDLVKAGLVEDRTKNGHVFAVTKLGYDFAA